MKTPPVLTFSEWEAIAGLLDSTADEDTLELAMKIGNASATEVVRYAQELLDEIALYRDLATRISKALDKP